MEENQIVLKIKNITAIVSKRCGCSINMDKNLGHYLKVENVLEFKRKVLSDLNYDLAETDINKYSILQLANLIKIHS